MNVETQQNIMLNCAHIEVQSAQVYCGMFAEAEVIPKGTINSWTTGCVDKAFVKVSVYIPHRGQNVCFVGYKWDVD